MASSLMFLLLAVVSYVSATENMICIILGCANPTVLANPVVLNQCKEYQCTLPQIGPSPIRMQFPQSNPQFSTYTFVPLYVTLRVRSLNALLDWAITSQLFGPSDLQAWKININRMKNETNINAENWSKELEKWYQSNAEVKELFKNVSRLISVNKMSHVNTMAFLDNSIVMDLRQWLKDHLPFSPKPVANVPFFPGFPPYMDHVGPFPQFPQLQPLPPFVNPPFDQFGFPIHTFPHPLIPGQGRPPTQTNTQCKPVTGCGKINVTFDVLVGNRSRCKAAVEEPRQNFKNLLILASHTHACLGFSTVPSNLANKKGEYLYSVDGIAETRNNKWVIKLKSTGAKVDLNTKVPSNGDYFYIDYASV